MKFLLIASVDSYLDGIAAHPFFSILVVSVLLMILGNTFQSKVLALLNWELDPALPSAFVGDKEESIVKPPKEKKKQESQKTTVREMDETVSGLKIPKLPNWESNQTEKTEKKKKTPLQETEQEKEQRRQRTEALQAKRKVHVDDIELPRSESKPKVETQPKTLKEGLEKTRKGWISRLNEFLVGQKELDDDLLEELEEILYTADIGTKTTQKLLASIEEKLEGKDLSNSNLVKETIREEIYKILTFDQKPLDFSGHHPFVVMVVGVNGAGKTTTIGKIAARLNKEGKKVLVAAGDTFRAAAAEQLEIWAERVGAELVRGQAQQDPSSVIFDAIQRGVSKKVDVILCDTAGRLQTQTNLMEELKKIKRVIDKALPNAPHEVLLVLDATTGQNAISQAKHFGEALEVTGMVLTKLDGTAKGGVVVAISEELKIPIRFIGIGEHIDELRTFDPNDFVDAIL